jgi:hypothetical protein
MMPDSTEKPISTVQIRLDRYKHPETLGNLLQPPSLHIFIDKTRTSVHSELVFSFSGIALGEQKQRETYI